MGELEQLRGEVSTAQIISIMTTEHFALQGARANTTSDANGRASIFLATVSSTLVAVAFVGQASALGTAFFVFSLVLFPALFFLGLSTFERVLQASIEDLIYARGINRIRHLYQELAPQVSAYFILSANDDTAGVLKNMAIRPSRQQLFLTTAGMISVINSLIAGAWAGLLTHQLGSSSLLIDFVVGGIVFLGVAWAQYRYQMGARQHEEMPVMFPSPSQESAVAATR